VRKKHPYLPFVTGKIIALIGLLFFQDFSSNAQINGNGGSTPAAISPKRAQPSPYRGIPPIQLNSECAAGASSICCEHITNVTISTINNNSGTEAGGYVDYTGSISTTLTAGQTYPISITTSADVSSDYIELWVDWNQNNSFGDAGELIFNYNSGTTATYSTSITVPAGATTGNCVMRICFYDHNFTRPSAAGCGTSIGYGEFEDYYLNVQPGLSPPASCTPSITNTFAEYISNVSITGDGGTNINNSTGSNGYTDYTTLKATVSTGLTYTLVVTNGSGYTTDGCDVWIDWNENGAFAAGSETIAYLTPSGTGAGGSVGPYTWTFTVPAGATIGDCRMRVAITDKHTSSGYSELSSIGCGTATYGEVEDYALHVVSGCSAPTTQATNVTFSSVQCSQMTVGWTNGNGANRIVVISPATLSSNPVSGTNYTANTTYASGTAIGNGYVVYNGNGATSVTVTGLTSGTTYYAQVFEYNCANWNYFTPTATNNPLSQPTSSSASTAVAGPNQFICGTTATMAATAPGSGTGTWTVLNGAGTITSVNSATSTITAIPATSYVTLRWTVSGVGCPSSSTSDVVVYTQ